MRRPATRIEQDLPSPHPLASAIAAAIRHPRTTSAVAAALIASSPIQAATFTVTNTNDAGPGSLRQAVLDANDLPGRDEVLVDSYVSGTVTLTSGRIPITDSLDIRGPGKEVLTVDGNDSTITVFSVENPDVPVQVTLSGLKIVGATQAGIDENWTQGSPEHTIAIAGCSIERNGRGVRLALGTDRIENSVIADNVGRGILMTGGSLTVSDSIVTGNGSGIIGSIGNPYEPRAMLEVRDTIISGNTGPGLSGTVITVTGSTISENGFGIEGISYFNSLDLSVRDSTVAGNAGPGISATYLGNPPGGLLTVENSVITGNQGSGVWVDAFGADVEIRQSTIANNVATTSPQFTDQEPGFGGGVFVDWSGAAFWQEIGYYDTLGSLTIENTTISGNEAMAGGGVYLDNSGLNPPPSPRISNTTIVDNAAEQGGGIVLTDFDMRIQNSIVARNSATDVGPDLLGTFVVDFSLLQDISGATIDPMEHGSNIIGEDPLLGPLQDNGGPTETHALLSGSPAIDMGDPAFVPPPEFDQRDTGFPRVYNGVIDMGAFELQSALQQYPYIELTSIPDINRNGTPELAALRTLNDGTPQVVIKDSKTKRVVSMLTVLKYVGEPIGLTPLLDMNGNGAPEVAVLFAKPDGGGLVKIKDGRTDAWVGQLQFFNKDWLVDSITSQDSNRDGVSEISVLATRRDGANVVAQIKDAVTKRQVNWIGFPVD